MYAKVASFAGSAMLIKSLLVDLLPEELTDFLFYYAYVVSRYIINLFVLPQLTMVINEYEGLVNNEIYEAAEVYLGGKINPMTRRLKLSKPKKEKNLKVSMEKDEEVIDYFNGGKFKWRLVCREVKNAIMQSSHHHDPKGGGIRQKLEVRSFQLTFDRKLEKLVMESYVPYVLETAKSIREAKKTVQLFTLDFDGLYETLGDAWTSVKLDHPSTFDTFAMDPELKKTIIDDLEAFVKRKEYYKRVGKAWKRGYLLYGPPGTGKSSLIAAMANYLNFDIYDLDLTELASNWELRKLLVCTVNKSILVVEDIDCSIDLQDRDAAKKKKKDDKQQVTLSGVLNFIDGLWSTCGDERIIIFTTNHKDKLDPALLRPGRMDMHINLSYCTPGGFRVLASNYLGMEEHPRFEDIEFLIKSVEVTPADVAEKLMKSDQPDIVIQELYDFLEKKKIEQEEAKAMKALKEAEGQGEKENQDKKKDGSSDDDDDDSSNEDDSSEDDDDSSDEEDSSDDEDDVALVEGEQEENVKKEGQGEEKKGKDVGDGAKDVVKDKQERSEKKECHCKQKKGKKKDGGKKDLEVEKQAQDKKGDKGDVDVDGAKKEVEQIQVESVKPRYLESRYLPFCI